MIQPVALVSDRDGNRRIPRQIQTLIGNPAFPILIILLLNLLLATWIVSDYGESWDEDFRYSYGERSLRAYSQAVERLDRDEKGPFYVMAALLAAEQLKRVYPYMPRVDRLHLVNFLSFEISLLFLYFICLRLVDKLAAVGVVLLFNTQPLLWGHAFVNPKDIPFMAFFTGSIALGIWMTESFAEIQVSAEDAFPDGVRFNRMELKKIFTGRMAVALALTVLIGLVLYFSRGIVGSWIAQLVGNAYTAEPGSRLYQLFSLFAENRNTIPAEDYILKGIRLYDQVLSLLGWGSIFLLLILAYQVMGRAVEVNAGGRRLSLPGLLARVILAGAFVGFSASIRVLGPAAGVLVGAYSWLKNGRKAFLVLPLYAVTAILVTYLTWPGLWGDAVQRYLGFITKASEFPFQGKALFFGVEYPATDLPRMYLPVMLSLQFTEVALILFGLGVIYGIYRARKGNLDRGLLVVISVWLFLPLFLAVIIQPPMYDNFRHFLFIVPPAFVFAGLGIAAVLDRLKAPAWKFIFLAAALLPGIYWLVQLHPYQYVYYNTLVGGPGGAFRRFETDYWALSYREATEYLNEVAPFGSKVVVWGPDHVVKRYAREDLEILEFKEGEGGQQPAPDYAILSSRWNNDQLLFPGAKTLFWVGRDGAVFAVVKQISSQPADAP
jgi:hypothetical protein